MSNKKQRRVIPMPTKPPAAVEPAVDLRYFMPVDERMIRPHRAGSWPVLNYVAMFRAFKAETEHLLRHFQAGFEDMKPAIEAFDKLQAVVTAIAETHNRVLGANSGDEQLEHYKRQAKRMADAAVEKADGLNREAASGDPAPPEPAQPQNGNPPPAPPDEKPLATISTLPTAKGRKPAGRGKKGK
ncbi:MAG: hypothetical protein IT464_12755 [Planctomycetes bacterium]|nr:hypothetical protein [Planctomycetota bacterium]